MFANITAFLHICSRFLQMTATTKIQSIFSSNSGYAHTADILAAGIHFSQLKKLLEEGKITQLKRGYYRWEDMVHWGSELPEIARLIPNGVFCLFTAAEYHGLSTFQSWQHHIAIERSVKITGLDKERIKLYYWPQTSLEFGVEEIVLEGGIIHITDPARTVCDVVKYRNKVGKDLLLEVIRNYVKRKDRNVNRIIDFAQRLRVENIIKPYLEIIL